MTSERIRVAVVFGGRSGEHPVSCISAAGVLANIDPTEFDVTAIGITPDGQLAAAWIRPPIPARRRAGSCRRSTDRLRRRDAGRPDRARRWSSLDPAAAPVEAALDVDVVFPVLHGPYGEDGTIQGLLELAGVPYVGAGRAGLRGRDGQGVHQEAAGRRGPAGRATGRCSGPGAATLTASRRERLGLPVFVKPARAGSSLGSAGSTPGPTWTAAIDHARQTDPKVLVEAAVLGREIECGVLEYPDGRIEASPTAEIHVGGEHEFYDFDAKYLDDVAATFDIPADLPDEVDRADPGAVPAGVHRAGRAGPGPGGLLRPTRTATW